MACIWTISLQTFRLLCDNCKSFEFCKFMFNTKDQDILLLCSNDKRYRSIKLSSYNSYLLVSILIFVLWIWNEIHLIRIHYLSECQRTANCSQQLPLEPLFSITILFFKVKLTKLSFFVNSFLHEKFLWNALDDVHNIVFLSN